MTASDRRRLDAIELAEAAVLSEVTVGLCLVGWLVPFGLVLTAAAVTPMAALAARRRPGALVAAGVCGAITALLVGGLGLGANVLVCTVLGAVVGVAERRGWSRRRTVGAAVATLWPVLTAVVIGGLAVFASLRRLALAQLTNTWHGTSVLLHNLGLGPVARPGDVSVSWLVAHWVAAVPVAVAIAVVASVWAALVIAAVPLRRLSASMPVTAAVSRSSGGVPGPVPVSLDQVSYRYPGAEIDAVSSLSLDVAEGELVAVVGPNGSGKSTLAKLLSGVPATNGSVRRVGDVALGRPGGTALIAQRPESQVLGMRVGDDVRWGLDPALAVDVGGLLERVGLAGFEARDTSTLSGGELQRLAVAAALARSPRLLISDETTAMVDHAGREQLMDVLAGLPEAGTSVVHVTHRAAEADRADRTLVMGGVDPTESPSRLALPDRAQGRRRVDELVLAGVGHVYDDGSPWAHRALRDVNVQVAPGEGVLLHGTNGSGKSTLAWIMAGLLEPTEGTALLGTQPVSTRLDRVGLSFQHARLQLQRPTVRAEVRSAAAVDDAAVDAALDAVGLDPTVFGSRLVDHLSGGQQRRVVLAGLVAAQPDLLVLDEPFAGLDDQSRRALIDALVRIRERTGLSLVLVSHDLEGCEALVERAVEVTAGAVVPNTRRTPASPAAADHPPRRAGARSTELRLFRVLPDAGPLHRVWAGTKLLALLALTLAATINTNWPTLGSVALVVVAGLLVGRVPRGAAPRIPRWLWLGLLVVGVASNALSGGAPFLVVGHVHLGVGSLLDWLRATVLALTLLVGAALVSWTTPLADVAPALQSLGRPLRWLHLPIDDWVTATALGLRSTPLLLDEVRVLAAARKLRAAHHPPARATLRAVVIELSGLLTAVMTVATRRATELAEAVTARGGPGRPTRQRPTFGLADVLCLALCALPLVVSVIT